MPEQALLLEPVRMEREVWFVCTTCGRRERVAGFAMIFPPPVCDHTPKADADA